MNAMGWARPVDAQRVFCAQCDQMVTISASSRCTDRFCRVRPTAAKRDARYDNPNLLSQISGASLQVCDLVFKAADSDALIIRLIRSDGRSDKICRMRHAIAYVAKERFGANFRTIGRALNRDHSTAIHSHRVGAALYARDMEFRDFCERIAS